jgi:hypothetical protein
MYNSACSFAVFLRKIKISENRGSPRIDVHYLELIKDDKKKGQLKRELSELNFQKYTINEFCSNRSQVIMALMNLRTHGIIEERILQLNNFFENNGYKASN